MILFLNDFSAGELLLTPGARHDGDSNSGSYGCEPRAPPLSSPASYLILYMIKSVRAKVCTVTIFLRSIVPVVPMVQMDLVSGLAPLNSMVFDDSTDSRKEIWSLNSPLS